MGGAPTTRGCAWRLVLGVAAVGVVAALASSMVIVESPGVRLLTLFTALLGTPFALLLILVGALVRTPAGRTVRSLGLGLLVLTLLQCVPVEVYKGVRGTQVAAAMAWCERLAARVDARIEATGEVPEEVDAVIAELGPPPQGVDPEHVYVIDGEGGYRLSFALSGAVIFADYWSYSSRDGTWTHLD